MAFRIAIPRSLNDVHRRICDSGARGKEGGLSQMGGVRGRALQGIWMYRDRRVLGGQRPRWQAELLSPCVRCEVRIEDCVLVASVARQSDLRCSRSKDARGQTFRDLGGNSVRRQAPHLWLL